MYPATDQLPTDAERAQDGVDWYVRKFRLESAETDARVDTALEVPEVRSRKWMFAVVALVFGLSAVLALATFVVSGSH